MNSDNQNKQIPRLSLINVSKVFKGNYGAINALEDISMEISAGEFVCLVGPSGCGKSTLLNILAGLEKPTSGQVLENNIPVKEPGPDRVMIFQEHALFPWLPVIGNVLFGLKYKKDLSKTEKLAKARQYLEMVGLAKFEKAWIHQLSGGMRQRVALARALVVNPQVLLMDEPFASLDAMTREQLYKDLQEIWMRERKTIIFVTHNVREAVCLGTRVCVFARHPGRITNEFAIDLPRPRTMNDTSLAHHASEITEVLKKNSENEELTL